MDGVAAEITQEIAVLFEHERLDPGAGEQEAGHHAGGTPSGDAAARGQFGHHCRSTLCEHTGSFGGTLERVPYVPDVAPGARISAYGDLPCFSASSSLSPWLLP